MAFFFFNDTATTEIYTLSLHDALPILHQLAGRVGVRGSRDLRHDAVHQARRADDLRRHRDVDGRAAAEIGEHTSELQSRQYLVCRLLLEKKKILTILSIIHQTTPS